MENMARTPYGCHKTGGHVGLEGCFGFVRER